MKPFITWLRAPAPLIVASLIVAIGLAGCMSMPGAGPVREVDDAGAEEAEAPADIVVRPPQPGESAQVDLVCASEAALLASAFLAGGEAQVAARIVRGQASSSRPLALSARLGGCERAVLVLGTTSETATVRSRVRDGSSASALVRCAP